MSFAAIKIDSVRTTVSTCPNNGTISVYATTNNPQLFYSIIAGPNMPYTIQTNNKFTSLQPGNYTIQVMDAAKETVTQQDVIVLGNYTAVGFTATSVSPSSCNSSSGGELVCNVTSGTGYPPFTWQLIDPSTAPSVPQESNTFKDLPFGNYTIQVTDGCGNLSTVNTSINRNSVVSFSIGEVSLVRAGCDSVLLSYKIFPQNMASEFNQLPSSIKYMIKNVEYIPKLGSAASKVDSSHLYNQTTTPYLKVFQVFTNIKEGDRLVINVFNSCGDSVSNSSALSTNVFSPVYDSVSEKCNATYTLNGISIKYGLKPPVHYSVFDMSNSLTITDSTIISNQSNSADSLIKYLPIHGTNPLHFNYGVDLTDGCGQGYSAIVSLPSKLYASVNAKIVSAVSCIDAVAKVKIVTTGFSNIAILILLSGPNKCGTARLGYRYSDTIIYPDTIQIIKNNFYLKYLPIGNYQFKIIDSCSNITDTFNINEVERLRFNNVTVKNECTPQKKIIYFTSFGDGELKMKNLATGIFEYTETVIAPKETVNSIANISPGKYEISYFFEDKSLGTTIPKNVTCASITDTIVVQEFHESYPSVNTANAIFCKNKIHLEIIPDKSNGNPPFRYQIIKGPQTFSIQSSNVFDVTEVGIYTARIYDNCGKTSVKDITVDSLSFLPIKTMASVCSNSIKLFSGSSVFYTYNWSKGTTFNYTGDTLYIPFVTPADTGIYTIIQYVKINGCTDTLHSTYHLYGGNYFGQDLNICDGSSIQIGTHNYTLPGVYVDTLLSIGGCDSIVQSNIAYLTPKTFKETLSACNFVVHNGNIYSSSTDLIDTVKSFNGCDSIYNRVAIFIKPLVPLRLDTTLSGCKSLIFKNAFYYSSAIVKDTVKSSQGCDSIYYTVNINVTPTSSPSLFIQGSDSICEGEAATYVAQTKNVGNKPVFKWELNGVSIPPVTDSIFVGKLFKTNDVIRCSVNSNAICQLITSAQSNAIKVVVLPKLTPSVNILVNNDAVCVGNKVEFVASVMNGGSNPTYLWQINNRHVGANIDTYESSTLKDGDDVNCIVTSNLNCVTSNVAKSNNINMSVSEGNCDTLFVPTIFNPISTVQTNNQILRPFSSGKTIKSITFKVFNRYGSLVFESHDLNNAWDGRVNGILQDVGTFVWTLAYTKSSGKPVKTSGTTVLYH